MIALRTQIQLISTPKIQITQMVLSPLFTLLIISSNAILIKVVRIGMLHYVLRYKSLVGVWMRTVNILHNHRGNNTAPCEVSSVSVNCRWTHRSPRIIGGIFKLNQMDNRHSLDCNRYFQEVSRFMRGEEDTKKRTQLINIRKLWRWTANNQNLQIRIRIKLIDVAFSNEQLLIYVL